METLKITLLNPKARKLIQNLVDLNIISISESPSSIKNYLEAVQKMRTETPPTLEEISNEVEYVRKKRNDEK